MVLVPGAVFAGFTIEALLGSGGMGEVYRARHPRLPRQVAVKVLTDLAARDASFRLRFEREGELAARVNHRNLVTVYDRGIEHGRPWICMEYVPGQDVSALIRHGPLRVEQAVYILGQAALGIDHAHRQELLHRDIKPANILVAAGDPGEGDRVLVSDFGIARSLGESTRITGTGGAPTTLAYAAPETFTDETVGPPADIYALGATLFEMLTGSVPYPRDTVGAVIHAQLSLPPPRPADLRPGLSAAFDPVIARAMAKDPAHRYATARELSDAAAAVIDTRPQRPPRTTPAVQPPPSRQAVTVVRDPAPSPSSSASASNSATGTARPTPGARSSTAAPGTAARSASPRPGAAARSQDPDEVDAMPSPGPRRSATPGKAASKPTPRENSSSRRWSRRDVRALALLTVIAAGIVGVSVGYGLIREKYYVGADGSNVVILRGRPGTVLGFAIRNVDQRACVTLSGQLSLDPSTSSFPAGCRELTVGDLRASARESVEHGLPLGSWADAAKAMDKLVRSNLLPVCTGATPPALFPFQSPPTTTVPAPTLGAAPTTTTAVAVGQDCRTVN
ncbi:protein kinase domain-containing protein [Nocardia tengchongensis]